MSMLWTGYDGRIWDLTSGRNGVCMLPGVRGLTMPPVTHHKSRTASVPGARWRGSSTEEREVFWPIQIYSDIGSVDWVAQDKAFWATMQPQRTGVWTVIQPSGATRDLTLRFRDDGQATFNNDPVLAGWMNYGITLDAEQPYWEGTPILATWRAGAPTQFFGGANIVTIASGQEATSAKIDNPGDVPTYPIWTLTGPLSAATLGIAGRTISIGFDIPSGSTLVVDTSPSVLTAMMGGTDRIASLGTSDFAPVPAGMGIPITLAVVGSGTVKMEITPLYYRAW
ncbi:MAG TPA: hypothetical protein VF867_12845 [Arthrobacter sp.]